MKAALIDAIGESPHPGEIPEPQPADDEVIVEVTAASLNPIDLAIATGKFFGGHPPIPFVPGIEAVGTTGDRFVRLTADSRNTQAPARSVSSQDVAIGFSARAACGTWYGRARPVTYSRFSMIRTAN